MKSIRRKPLMFGIICGALVLALAAWQFAKPTAAESAHMERYLPADTIGFVEANNLRTQARRVIDSEAWRAFTKENQAASSFFMMAANHTGVLDASYALALLGTSANEGGERHPEFALVAEFDSRSARQTFENRVLRLTREALEKGARRSEEPYGDVKIQIVTGEHGHAVSYAQTGTTLVISNTTGAIKKVLDVRAGKIKSIETNETFAQARAQATVNDGMFGFLNVAAFTRMMDSIPAGEKEGASAFQKFFHGVGADSVESVALTSSFVDGRVVERVVVNAPNGKTGLLATIGSNAPTERALLAYVPADALQAFDASIANAPQTFDQFEALVNESAAQGSKRTLGEVLRDVTDKTSIDLRGEIVGALGAEVCIAQLPGGEDGRSGVLVVNLKNEQSFAQALEKMAQHKKLAVTTRDYEGIAIRTLAGEGKHGLSYAFLNGNLIASGDAGAVERVINTARGGAPALAASDKYRAASASVNASPQFVYYNSNADYVNRLGSMLKSRDYAFKVTGAQADLQPSFAFGVSRPDGFYVESRTPLGTFPRLLTAVTAQLAQERSDVDGTQMKKQAEEAARPEAQAATKSAAKSE